MADPTRLPCTRATTTGQNVGRHTRGLTGADDVMCRGGNKGQEGGGTVASGIHILTPVDAAGVTGGVGTLSRMKSRDYYAAAARIMEHAIPTLRWAEGSAGGVAKASEGGPCGPAPTIR